MSKEYNFVYFKDFCNYSIQYYLAGRASAIFGSTPICANILHHSIEMVLKAGLIKKNTANRPEDKDYIISFKKGKKSGHDLESLWSEFKSIYPEASLNEYDDFILNLNKWDEIRYPSSDNLGLLLLFDPEKVNMNPPAMTHKIVIKELDELFVKLFDLLGYNFKGALKRICSISILAKEIYIKENNCIII